MPRHKKDSTPGPSLSTLMFMKNRLADFNTRRQSRAVGLLYHRPVVENTYQTGPMDKEQYKHYLCEKIVRNSLKFFLQGFTYEHKLALKMSKVLAEDIKRKLRHNFSAPRYKLIVQVVVGQMYHQTLEIASRTLSNVEVDTHVSVTEINNDLFACAIIHCMYFE